VLSDLSDDEDVHTQQAAAGASGAENDVDLARRRDIARVLDRVALRCQDAEVALGEDETAVLLGNAAVQLQVLVWMRAGLYIDVDAVAGPYIDVGTRCSGN
jgi:hypothetical protein